MTGGNGSCSLLKVLFIGVPGGTVQCGKLLTRPFWCFLSDSAIEWSRGLALFLASNLKVWKVQVGVNCCSPLIFAPGCSYTRPTHLSKDHLDHSLVLEQFTGDSLATILTYPPCLTSIGLDYSVLFYT